MQKGDVKQTYANLKENSFLQGHTPPPQAWKDHRKDWIFRDFSIVNESAKNINVDIINLNHNTWYNIFKKDYLK